MHDTVDDALVGAWHRLAEERHEATQMSQPEWFASVLSSLPDARPVVLTRGDGDRLDALVAGRIEHIPVPARVGYRQILPGTLSTLQVMQGCVLGPLDPAEEWLGALLGAAATRGAHAVAFPLLPIDHSLVGAVARRRRPWRRTTAPTQIHHRSLLGPGGYDELMAGSASTRKRVRKYERKLARDHEVELEVFSSASDVERFLLEAEPIAATSYQHALGAGLAAEGETQRLRELAGLGWFRGYLLRVDGTPWTYDYGFLHDGVFIASGTGYLVEHAKARPGNIALARWIDDLAGIGVTEIDWGSGDAEYKRSLSSRATREKPTVVYRRTVPGTAYAVAGTLVDAVDRSGRYLVRRLGHTRALKALERDRLRSDSDATD